MIKKVNFPELKNENFTIIPIPFEDELLSSWIVRTAYAHQTHPHTFTNQYLNFRKHSFFLTESDMTLDEQMIQMLEAKSLYKVDVRSLMLKSYSGYIQETLFDNVPLTFFTPLKFCPMCLQEDKIPYFRKRWRVIFYTICHKHNCYLYEKCSVCGAKIDISQMYYNKERYVHCHKCGLDFRQTLQPPFSEEIPLSLYYQNKIFKILDDGYVILENAPIYSFLFFKIFLKLSKLILADKHYQTLSDHLLGDIIKNAKQQSYNHPIFKRVDVKVQSALFGLIMYLFEDFPHNLRRYITANKLTHRDLTTKMVDVPFWYEEVVNEIVPKYMPHSMSVTREEVENAKRYLIAIGKDVNKMNLSELLDCNFYSRDNKLHCYMGMLHVEDF